MFSQTLFLGARKALSVALALSLMASSAPAYAANMWYCGIATQAFATATSWSVNDSCGANPAAAPGAGDVAYFDKSAAGRTIVMSGSTALGGLVLAKSFTGTLKQHALLRVSSMSGGFKMGSGYFVGGNYPMTVSGSLTMTGGVLTGIMTNLTISGSVTLDRLGTVLLGSPRGTFTSTGTITMGGARSDQNFTIGAGVTRTLRSLTINNRGGTTADDIIVSASGGLNLTGALTVTLGNLDLATRNVALAVEGSITIADNAQATIETDQNIAASGTILVNDAGVLTVSGGTLTLNDDSDQAVDLDGQRIFALTINNAGAAGVNDVVYAGGALDMSGALTVTLGSLDMNTNSLATVVKGGGITVTNTAQATFEAGGNLTMSGSLSVGDSATFSIPLTATVKVNGVFANIDTNNTALYALTVNSASGARLTSPQRVFNTVTIGTGGTLSLVAFTLSATGATFKNYGSLKESTGKFVHSGATLVTNAAYTETAAISPGTPAFFQVTDSDENITGTAADTITITASIAQSGDSETVTLTETTNNSGVFQGSIATAFGSATSDSKLTGTENSTITGSFTDAEDALVHADSTTWTVRTAATGDGATTSGGGGGGGGGGGRSYLKSTTTIPTTTTPVKPVVPKVVTPMKKQQALTLKERLAQRIQQRKERMARIGARKQMRMKKGR